ncbi:hypothetical protein RJI07_05655 [Mycoplasmatota bacterium WC30]
MRVFGRVLYAVVCVGFFLLAYTFSRDLMLSEYLKDVFAASLTDTESEYPKYYYFYTSIPDYHNDEPLFSIDSNGYEIMGYEVLISIINNNNEAELTEFVYVIVYSDNQDLSQVDYLYLENESNGVTLDIDLQRFKTLNILNGVNELGYVYLYKDPFFAEDFDKINLLDKNGNMLVDTDFSIEETDFIIKDFVEDFYANNGRLPLIGDIEGLPNNNIFPNKPQVAEGYQHIFYTAMGIYFVITVFMTYIIFFWKKKIPYEKKEKKYKIRKNN